MKRIASFSIDHEKLLPGLYISRIDQEIITYDLRMTKPNLEPVLSTGTIHAIEHIGATYLRNSAYGGNIVYFGPMGCRTGFYLLVRDSVSLEDLQLLLIETFSFIKDFTGDIPGASPKECGNWRDMDLELAKATSRDYLQVLKSCKAGNYI